MKNKPSNILSHLTMLYKNGNELVMLKVPSNKSMLLGLFLYNKIMIYQDIKVQKEINMNKFLYFSCHFPFNMTYSIAISIT